MMTLEAAYRQFAASLHTYAVHLTHDEDDAWDLVSESFFRAMPSWEKAMCRPTSRPLGYLKTIIEHVFIDSERRKRRIPLLPPEALEQEEDPTPSPLLSFLRWETAEQVRQTLLLLPQEYRDLLQRHFFEGKSLPELMKEDHATKKMYGTFKRACQAFKDAWEQQQQAARRNHPAPWPENPQRAWKRLQQALEKIEDKKLAALALAESAGMMQEDVVRISRQSRHSIAYWRAKAHDALVRAYLDTRVE